MPDAVDEYLRKFGAPPADDPVNSYLSKYGAPPETATAVAPKPEPAVTIADNLRKVMGTGIPDVPSVVSELAGKSDDERAAFVAGQRKANEQEQADAERATHGFARRAFVDAPVDVLSAVGSGAVKGAIAFNEGAATAVRTGKNFVLNAMDRSKHDNPFEGRADDASMLEGAKAFADREHEANATRSPNFRAITEHTDKIGEMAGGIGSSMLLGGANFPLMEALKNPDRPVAAAAEAKLFMSFQGALHKAMAGADPSKLRAAASNAASAYIAGRSSGQSHDEALGAALAFGVKDLASAHAPAKMGVNNPNATATERGTAPVIRPEAAPRVAELPTAAFDAAMAGEPVRGAEPVRPAEAAPEAPVAAPEAVREIPAAEPAAPGRPPAPDVAAPQPGDPTSVKNAVANRERVERGLGELEAPFKVTFADTAEKAIDTVANEPHKPYNLVDELAKKPRAATPDETAILTIHKVNLYNARDAARAELKNAEAAGDVGKIQSLLETVERLHGQMNVIDKATHESGTESGRSLAFRRMMMNRDYSLAAIESSLREATGYREMKAGEIEALNKEAETIHAEISKARAELDAIKAKREASTHAKNIDTIITSESPKVTAETYGKANKIVSRETYEATKAAMRAKLNRLNAGIDPTILADLAKMGAFHLEAGARKFAAWSKAMKDDLGANVDPYLKDIWDASRKALKEPTIGSISEKVRERVKAGNRADMNEIGKLAELLVRAGEANTRDELIDKVHEVLVSVDPARAREQTMADLSGYGALKRLSADPVKAKIREYRGEIQQLLKINDLENDRNPAKSGVERQAPGPEQRALIKQVNEAKRAKEQRARDRGEPEAPPSADELRSATDAMRTRWEHDIEDMDRQIARGVKDVPTRTDTPLSPEMKSLKDRRDAKKAQYDEVFGNPGMSDEARIAAAEKATEKEIIELRRQVSTGDVFSAESKPGPTSARLEELRQQKKALAEQKADMKAAATPRLSPIERIIGSRTKRREARIADLNRRIEGAEFEAKKRAVIPPAPEEIASIARESRAIQAFEKAKAKHIIENERLRDTAVRVAFKEIPSIQRMVQFGADFSIVGLQGGPAFYRAMTSGDPMAPFRAFGESLKVTFRRNEASLQNAAESEARITSDPMYALAKRDGLAFSGIGGASAEEIVRSRWGESIPVLRNLQRGVGTFMNRARFDFYKALSATMTKTGVPTPEEGAHIAAMVNMFTGRSGGKSQFLDQAGNVLLAPRWYVSRYMTALGVPMYHGGSARTKRLAAKEYGRLVLGMGVLYGMAAAFGRKIDGDPLSANFGDIDLGNGTHVNPSLGLSTVYTLFSRIAVKTGIVGNERDKRRINDDFLGSHVRGKLLPLWGAAYSANKGTTQEYEKDTGKRQKATLGNVTTGLVTPLALDDIYKTMVQQGIPKGFAMSALSIFGLRVRNDRFGPKKR